MDFYSDTSTNNESIRFMKRVIVLLLTFVFSYSVLHQYKTYQVMGTHLLKELPIYSVDIGETKKVCVTFDSAWGTEDLSDILEILKNHNCIATFFVTGEWASDNPEAIKQIAKAGHIIGNHGEHHKHMTTLTKSEMQSEIKGCHEIVKQITGQDMIFFRAPYGDYNDTVVEIAKSESYYTIQWSVDSLDWKDYGTDSIIHTVCEHKALQNGAIILLHNGTKYTHLALDDLLTTLEQKGYSFISLSDLIIRDNYGIDHTGRQFAQ